MLTIKEKSIIRNTFKTILILVLILSLAACENPFDALNDNTDDNVTTENNSTISTADPIDFGTTYNKSISTNTDVDYYSITIPAESSTRISITNLTDNLDLYILDNNENILMSSINGGSENESIYFGYTSTSPTTMYIKINGYAGATSDYTLLATNDTTETTDGNDTITTSETIVFDTTYNKSISTDTDVDYYSITIPAESTTTISLTNLTDNLDLYILDSNEDILMSSINGGSEDESINFEYTSTSTATMYIKINGYAGATSDYTLLATNDIIETTNDNDTITTSESIEFGTTYNKSISTITDVDYYSITIPAGSTTTISLTNLTDDLDIYLLDNNDNILMSSEHGGSDNEYINYNNTSTSTSTMYIKVEGYNGATSDYTLLATNDIIETTDDNDTIETADPIDFDTPYSGRISTETDIDYYSITIPEGSTVTFSLTGLTADLDMYILDSYGSTISSSTNGSNSDEIITYTSTSTTTYYIEIEAYWFEISDYTLSVLY